MASAKKEPYPSVRLFKRDWMEALTHVHPALPVLFWGPVVLYYLYRSWFVHDLPTVVILGLGVLALIVWTLAEYLLHRFVFHFHPKNELGAKFVHLFHGVHHDDPNDPTRLVMPPVVSVVLAIIFYSIFDLAFGPVLAEPFFAFFIIGYLAYDYIHYATHHFRMSSPVGKYLKKYHMDHHFQHPDDMYGVSNPLWDYVFGTTRPSTKKSESAS